MNNILVIDDDKDLCFVIKKYAERAGYSAHFSHTGSRGLCNVEENNYELVILDIMLPEIDGFSVLREIRQISKVPVLMLTAKNEEVDKIKGLKLGADDYLTKPFSMDELMARIESLVRRYTKFNQEAPQSKSIILKNMAIDPEKRIVIISGNQVELTSKEFDLLYFLASNKGKVFTKKQIYSQVWDEEYAFDDSNIMSFISKLRKKIENDMENLTFIQTIRGVGYRFNEEA